MSTKIAIGCLVQWYEVEVIDDYLLSLKNSISEYEIKGDVQNLYLDFDIYIGKMLEKPISNKSATELGNEMYDKIVGLKHYFPNLNINCNIRKDLITISDYRREFNSFYSGIADVLIWGESDMIAPKELFTSVDMLHSSDSVPSKYIATFAITKMWDSSWTPLEHPTVKDKPFIEGDTENWWSVRYTMSIEELYKINDLETNLSINEINPIKFNGCGLVISSEVIKSGVNIPKSVFFVHEDTAFMIMLQKILPNIKQLHFSNILLAHNRKNPKKRMYILGEDNIDKTDMGALRKSHPWYTLANKMSESNCYNLFDTNYKSYSWEDVFKKLQN